MSSSEQPVRFPASGRSSKRLSLQPPATPEPDDESPWGANIDLRRMWAVFRRHLRLFVGIVLVVFVGAVILTMRATPMYTATANVMLDVRKSQVMDSEAVLSGLPADAGVVDTEVEVLKSRHLAERVVEYAKLEQDPEFNGALQKPKGLGAVIGGVKGLFSGGDRARGRQSAVAQQKAHEAVVDNVLARLGVKRAGLTFVINVSFTSEDPAKAARIANAFANRYLTEQLEAKFQATQNANQWLNERLGQLKIQVQEAEAAVRSEEHTSELQSH